MNEMGSDENREHKQTNKQSGCGCCFVSNLSSHMSDMEDHTYSCTERADSLGVELKVKNLRE